MTFEIAAVYGWDIREGDNLYLLSTMLMAEGLATETADVFLSNYLVPLMAKKLATKFGFQLGSELASQLAQRSIRIFLQLFTRRAQEQLAKEALEGTAKGIGKTVLGWATLGAAIIISAGADAVATWYLGRQIETMSKRWLHDLLLEGQTYLARPEHRDCAFRSLAAVAWADGEVTDNEQRLFQAFLGKPYAADEQTWFTLGSDERVRQSAMLAGWPENDDASGVRSCLTNRFQKSDPEHRVSLLGHLYSMMLIDGDQGPEEFELYEEYRDGLDGSGWFDGSAISEDQMLYIERAVFLTVNPNIVLQEVSEEYDVVTHGLLTQDVLDFLAEPNETVQADFDCGFASEC